MSNKIRYGRSRQRLRPENMTHGPACDSLRGLALGRKWWKRRQHHLMRRGLRVVRIVRHPTPGVTTVHSFTGRVNKHVLFHNTPRPAHMNLIRHYRTASAAHPWKRELEDDNRREAYDSDAACSDEQHG